MKLTVTKNMFCDLINKTIPNNFSQEGIEAIFNYITEKEEETEKETEFDAIALRCEYVEYESYKELLKDYPGYSIEELKDTTRVIELTHGGVLIEPF